MQQKVYRCKMNILSPIHIGAGTDKKYGPYEYISAKAKFHKEIVPIIKRINLPEYYKSLPEVKKDELLEYLEDSRFKLSQLQDKSIKDFTNYTAINYSTKRIDEIQEHIKTNRKLYIPGSSIKGAINTAIMYDAIGHNEIQKIEEFIKNGRKGKYIDNRAYVDFLRDIFSSKKGNYAQNNIMRFIQVSDTNYVSLPKIYDVISLQATTNESYNYYNRNGNTVRSFIETTDVESLMFTLNIKYDEKILEKIHLEDKKDKLDINYLKKVIYQFSKDYIEYELDYIKKYNVDILSEFYEELENRNSIDKPLLRIGSGSGFMMTTINMKIKQEDPYLFEEIRKMNTRSYDYEYPKSRKVTCKDNKPLGWIQLEFKGENI